MPGALSGPETVGSRPAWRRAVTWCGVGLTIAAFAFILHQVATADWSGLATRGVLSVTIGTAVAAIIYGAAGMLLATAWWRLLVASAGRSLPPLPVLAIYATTQAYKYLPSNVLHFVGRHVLLKPLGISHLALLSAASLEIAALLAAAMLLAGLSGWPLVVELAQQGTWLGSVDLRLLLLIPALALAGTISIWLRADLRRLARRHLPAVALALLLYVVFFTISALVLMILARGALGLAAPGFVEVLAIATTAWILGFVVPGAPAGIGIREAVLILLLEPQVGQANAVALAALYRLATMGGDGLLAAGALAAQRLLPQAIRR